MSAVALVGPHEHAEGRPMKNSSDCASNLVLLDPDPKQYRELARSKVCGETWAHPALANGRLYVRDAKEVICLKLNERGSAEGP